jgi:hypothetical protein
MAARDDTYRDFRFARAIPTDPVDRLEAIARFMDGALVIPGTRIRFGADALIGLVPGIGDAVTAAVSLYLIWEARNLGLPRTAIARMVANVAVDALIGAVPVAGDALDVFWRANLRNLKIVREHLRRTGRVIDAEYVRVD